jgi:transposase-like protein
VAAANPDAQLGPRPGTDYPTSLGAFLDWFQSEEACWRYLVKVRWPDGFSCPRCGHDDAWFSARRLFVCSACGKNTSAISGTIFEGTRLPLLTWFRAIWFVSSQKDGMSAKALQEALGIGSYKAAWTMLHKIRTAMRRTSPDLLSGEIEVDETFVGGPRPGKPGRGAVNKQIVIIAVEKPTGHVKKGYGRVRMQVIPDCKRKTLEDFISDTCAPGSIIYTDGLKEYKGLPNLGYMHHPTAVSQTNDPAHIALPAVHRVASLFKRWLLGTHQGGVAEQHLDAYLDEFVFRFNRRKSRRRGLLFYRLMCLAVSARPTTYDRIVWSRRGQASKVRGPRRKATATAHKSAAKKAKTP